MANATNNDGQDPETLFVSACYADEGPTLKRWRPRARGRATRIRKRTCHITIIVSRLGDLELRLRTERDARSGRVAGGTAGRASRRARVARSKQAETHDHDHDHDHDDEVLDTDVAVEVDEVTVADDDAADEATEAAETAPAGDIKGNADSMKYHVPGSQWYDQTEAEVWFATTEDAEAAGYEPAGGAAKQDVDADEKDND